MLKREQTGAVTVTSTILFADRFAFYTEAGRFYECYADSPEELHVWMDAMPAPSGAKVEGWVYKHKRGAKGSHFQRRYATYEMESGVFNYFTDETRSVPKGRATVQCAVANRSGRSVASSGSMSYTLDEPAEFTIRTEDGKFFDVIVEGIHIRDEWISALPTPPSHTMLGWIYERYEAMGGLASGGKRPRYGVFDMKTGHFATYLSEESALLDDCEPQFKCIIKYALPRPQKEPLCYEFAFNSEEEHKEGRGRFHEYTVDSEELQAAWVDALPPPRQFTVQGYLHKRRVGARKLGSDFDKRYAVYDVISGFFAYYETEQEAKLDMKPRGAARVVSAVLRPTNKIPYLFSFFSDDGKDFQLYVDDLRIYKCGWVLYRRPQATRTRL